MLTAEEKIKAFDKLWYSSLVGIALVTKDGKFRAANEAFTEIVEYTEYNLQQMSIQDIAHPQDIDAITEMSRRVAAGELRDYTMKTRYITKTGRTVWCALRVVPVTTELGHLEFFIEQVSEIIDMPPDKMPSQYPTADEIVMRPKVWESWRKYWPIIAAGMTASAMIVAEIIKQLK